MACRWLSCSRVPMRMTVCRWLNCSMRWCLSKAGAAGRARGRTSCTPTRPMTPSAAAALAASAASNPELPAEAWKAANGWAATGGSLNALWHGLPACAACPSATNADSTSITPSLAWRARSSASMRFREGFERHSKVLHDQAMSVDYANFKSTVKASKRHDAYMSVWSAMYAAQGR